MSEVKKIQLPLFWKFSIAVVLIVLLFGSINTVLIYRDVKNALREEIQKRGLFIAQSLAEQITSSLLFEDYATVQNIINGIKSIDNSIAYIIVVDEADSTVVSTFGSDVPAALLNANDLGNGQESNSQVLTFKGQRNPILDIAVPMLGGKLGTVRIGIVESKLQKQVDRTVNVFIVMVAAFLSIGILGAFVFAKLITDPIKTMKDAADKLDFASLGSQGAPRIQVRDKLLGKFKMLFRTEDEIDALATRFNEMIERLESAHNDLVSAQTRLLQSEKLATVGTLAAGLAHEINNPIAGIENCVRRIKEYPDNIEQNVKYLSMMENAVAKIEKVVSNLLNFARKPPGESTLLSIEHAIENALVLVSHRLEKLRISTTNEIDLDLPRIDGDRSQLEQVFVNLFLNSIDAIEERCKVDPNCERRLILRSSIDENKIIVEVNDSGVGIPNENLGKVFDPFFTTKPVGKGTGLGLSIGYNIVNAHNGSMRIESNSGNGTSVYLEFPFKKKKEVLKKQGADNAFTESL